MLDKWEMGWGAMSLGWSGWRVDHAHGICATSPLVALTVKRENRNGNCENERESQF